MICEICHKKKAEQALEKSDEGEELYLCKDCAQKEAKRREKLRKEAQHELEPLDDEPGSIGDDGGSPPRIIRSIVEAVSDIFSNIGNIAAQGGDKSKTEVFHPLRLRQKSPYILNGRLHLEALHLIGELEAVIRGCEALDVKLVGINPDGIANSGHMFTIQYKCNEELAKRALTEILAHERNARLRLLANHRRIIADSLSRALAILKNCHMLSPGEYFDLLSPMRLAAQMGYLSGLNLQEIDEMIKKIEFNSKNGIDNPEELDMIDSMYADDVNRVFARVKFNTAFAEILEY